MGYLEFATVYFSQSKAFYQIITKQRLGAISTISADVQAKRNFWPHLGPARLGTPIVFLLMMMIHLHIVVLLLLLLLLESNESSTNQPSRVCAEQ